jgi:hypothetical protein
MQSIGACCFADCRALAAIPFESGCQLSLVDRAAFQNCSSLLSIYIPSSVHELGKECFRDVKSLSTVTFESGSQLSKIGESAFWACPSLSSISIPSSVQTLCNSCFCQCTALWAVTFESPSDLVSIGPYAFSECSALLSVFIPFSVKRLGWDCFRKCTSLVTVTLESGSKLSQLEKEAFLDCKSLSSIYIPSSIQYGFYEDRFPEARKENSSFEAQTNRAWESKAIRPCGTWLPLEDEVLPSQLDAAFLATENSLSNRTIVVALMRLLSGSTAVCASSVGSRSPQRPPATW